MKQVCMLFMVIALFILAPTNVQAAGINTLRFQEGIVIQVPNSWILLPGDKNTILVALRYDSGGSPAALLRITKTDANLGFTHTDIGKMSASDKKDFLSGFVESYLKSVSVQSDIEDRKVLVSEIDDQNGFQTISIISSGVAAGEKIIITTKIIGFKEHSVQYTLWAKRAELEKNVKEFSAIEASFMPGKAR